MRNLRAALLLLGSITLFPALGHSQSLLLTGIMDGDLTGGNPKFLEFYAPQAIADLSIFTIERASNGGAWTSITANTTLSGSLSAGGFLYVTYANTTPEGMGFQDVFGFAGSLNTNANGNGNDAFRVLLGATVLDVFGDPTQVTGGSSDYTAPWAYNDSYAVRKSQTTADGTWQLANWTLPGSLALDTLTKDQHAAAFLANFGKFTPVPEAGHFALAAGLAGLALLWRRRR